MILILKSVGGMKLEHMRKGMEGLRVKDFRIKEFHFFCRNVNIRRWRYASYQ